MAKATDVVLAVMDEVQGLAKKDRNTQQGFSFRGIDAVMNAVGPALRKAGGFIIPEVIHATHTTVTTAKGSVMNAAHLEVAFRVYGSEGEPIFGSAAAEAFDSGDKATAKAMSVAYRTFLLQLLCLPTDEPDPDSFSYEATLPARDFVGEAEAKALNYDLEGLRKLYAEAVAAKAPATVIEKVKAYGNDIAGQTNSAGQPGRG